MTSGYGTVLRRHVFLVILLGLAGLLLGALVAEQRDKYYEASADVRLAQVASPFRSSDGTRADLSRALQTQIDLATGDQVRSGLGGAAGAGADVDVKQNGELDELRFTAKAETAQLAAEAANAWAASYVAVLKAQTDESVGQYRAAMDAAYARVTQEIEAVDAERQTAAREDLARLDLRRDVLVTELKALAGRRALDSTATGLLSGEVVRKANPPSEPANDDEQLQFMLLGLCGGLVVGYIVACVVEARRDLVRASEDVALVAPREPVLGPVGTGSDVESVDRLSAGMGYLSLRAEVLAVASDVRPPVLGVLSASGEAETTAVALGLALALRRQGQWVLLVDGSTEAAGTPGLLPVDDAGGLGGILFDRAPVASSVSTMRADDGTDLLVLAAGRLPTGALSAPALGPVVDQLISEHQLDAVVIAAGSAARSPDATAVAVVASAVLVVATLGRTRRRQLALALHRLEMLAPKARAVVLARAARPAKTGRRRAERGTEPATAVPAGATAGKPTEEGLTGAPRGVQ